ncbi:hypothetical protein Q8A73_016713 [Channa argus]|nr:hypothetical protein Q8A73_016713 [Channa argus]
MNDHRHKTVYRDGKCRHIDSSAPTKNNKGPEFYSLSTAGCGSSESLPLVGDVEVVEVLGASQAEQPCAPPSRPSVRSPVADGSGAGAPTLWIKACAEDIKGIVLAAALVRRS